MILFPEHKCYMCGETHWLELHHCFNNAYKKKSEQYGALVYLCHNCHNEPPNGVHHNAENMQKLKAEAQRRVMAYHDLTKEQFIEIFGKNYLEE